MKKENRKLAQELRAAERKKKAFLRRLKRILTVVIPLLAVLILVSVIVWDSVSSKEEETASNSAAEEQTSGTDVTADSASYSTDASLTVQNGDTVNIDYVGTVGGVEFDGGSTNGAGTDLTIGSGLYIDDFEEQLIGSHPGDTVEVNVTFPEDYNAADLAGKDAVFEVIINGIYQ